jgi:hypothetical protein
MASTAARRFVLISIVGVVAGGTLYCCPPPPVKVFGQDIPRIEGYAITNSFRREAKGGGLVTVDVAVLPGALPSWNVPPGSPQRIGWFSNRGEGGKREKRYDFKPNRDTVYELELSNDSSTRTKWTLYERHGLTRTAHKQGHLWMCDADAHGSVGRAIGFYDCTAPVTYDPGELSTIAPTTHYFFASFVKRDDRPDLLISPAAWISCTTGCCSLGT